MTQQRLTSEQRQSFNGHPAFALWFTGLPGSGKTTLAAGLEKELLRLGYHCYVLDGDILRKGLNEDLGFTQEDRAENIRRASHVARILVDAGLIVITAFISPYLQDRSRARALFDSGAFFEIFVDCPLEICESRDPKGHYKKARAGMMKDFTGISAPYERPQSPDLVIPTNEQSVEESVQSLIAFLETHLRSA